VSNLVFVSAPDAVQLQTYWTTGSEFNTYAGRGDGTQQPGTAARQCLTLEAGDANIVDLDAAPWLTSLISAYGSVDPWSALAISDTLYPAPNATPLPITN
jgi:hypothetical protein